MSVKTQYHILKLSEMCIILISIIMTLFGAGGYLSMPAACYFMQSV